MKCFVYLKKFAGTVESWSPGSAALPNLFIMINQTCNFLSSSYQDRLCFHLKITLMLLNFSAVLGTDFHLVKLLR